MFLGDYTDFALGKHFWEMRTNRLQQALRTFPRFRDATEGLVPLDAHVHDTQRRQGSDALLDREIEMPPGPMQLPDDRVGSHHYQGVPPGARFRPDIHRSHFQMRRLTGPKRLFHQGEILVPLMDHRRIGHCPW